MVNKVAVSCLAATCIFSAVNCPTQLSDIEKQKKQEITINKNIEDSKKTKSKSNSPNANANNYKKLMDKKPKAKPKKVDNKTTNVYIISGLDEQGIKEKVKGTWMENDYHALYLAEQQYNINFRAIYAIGALESGRGQVTANTHNYFGLRKGKNGWMSFSTKQQAILYEAKLLNNPIYKGKTLEEINKIYCPPNPKWSKDVKSIMKEI